PLRAGPAFLAAVAFFLDPLAFGASGARFPPLVAFLGVLVAFGASWAPCGATGGVRAWAAFQIRARAVVRSLNFLTGATPGRLFQSSSSLELPRPLVPATGQEAASWASSFSEPKYSAPA